MFDPVPIDMCFYPNSCGYVTGEPSGSTQQPLQYKEPPPITHMFGSSKTGTRPDWLNNVASILATTSGFHYRRALEIL
jgi:hypothetical protein